MPRGNKDNKKENLSDAPDSEAAAAPRGGPGQRGGGAGLARAGATDEQGGLGGDAATDQGHDKVKTGQRRVTRTSG